MPSEVWMFLVQVLAGIMLLVLALVAVNTYVDWCHAYKAGRALDEWRVAIVRAGWCEAAGEVLPRRDHVRQRSAFYRVERNHCHHDCRFGGVAGGAGSAASRGRPGHTQAEGSMKPEVSRHLCFRRQLLRACTP